MARIFQSPANRAQHYRHFVMQKHLVEKHFPAFRCRLNRGLLECTGDIRPTDESESYTVRVSLTEWGIPAVRVVKPHIEHQPGIHMYRNGTLCLYHPPTQPWSGAYDLHKTIVPWTAEWLVYYELFLSEGKWLGPEVPHGDLPSH
jgi:hypothetical protein